MADLTEKNFGFQTTASGSCQCPCPPPPPPPHCPAHGCVPIGDWVRYINMYIDVRARQIYDKLKAMFDNMFSKAWPYILLKDEVDGNTYKITIRNGSLCSRLYGEEPIPEVVPTV